MPQHHRRNCLIAAAGVLDLPGEAFSLDPWTRGLVILKSSN